LRPALLAVLGCALSACSAIRFGGAGGRLEGFWSGSLLIEGQSIASSLVLEGDAELEATLSAPSLRLEAEGEGSAQADRFSLTLAYELTCPGVMTLAGTVQGGTRLAGELEARDCTGTVQGTFSFAPGSPGVSGVEIR
jgi:hypothetical protein